MKLTWKRLFWRDDEGSILAEAMLVIPVVTIFAVGILEFGNVFWQRHLLEVGVRDAARYWARCRPLSGSEEFMHCSQTIARNIAIYGNPAGTGNFRVPNWQDGAGSVTIEPAEADIPSQPTPTDVVIVKGTMTYAPSPLFRFLRTGNVAISYTHMERYYGW